MAATMEKQLEVGEQLGKFRVERVVPIEELQCDLYELRHEPTGARVMHIATDDTENVFSLSFQTLPSSSNGVAHILEHTVLCGSKKFPVRDPFFSMNRRSLNTFMNAFTGADFTCYPAASQVEKDFYNLLEVYLDAVFHPILDERSFRQEGHRLEFTNPEDPESPLEFKGIVFNEMKGSLSSPERRLWEAVGVELFPDVTYGVNSGGEPRDIPKLTYEELIDFHRVHYHPSRCLFFFYGNLPLKQHLDFIETHALKDVTPQPPLPAVPLQPRFGEPRRSELPFPIAEDEDPTDKGICAFAWLTCPIEDQLTVMGLSVLDLLLTGTDAAPLKRALLRSGLVKTAGLYMDEEIREVPFILLAKDCAPENADKIEELVRKTLAECAREGFSEERVEAALHQLEIGRCEITGDGHPFGLLLFMRAALLRQHGVTPETGLTIHSLFAQVRKLCKDPQYLPQLIHRYLLDNTHMVRVMMRPDKELAATESSAEEQTLQQIRLALTHEERKSVLDGGEELKRFQEEQEHEDIEVLPKVTLADVPAAGPEYPLSQQKHGELQLFQHEAFTNQMAYVDLVFDLPAIAQDDLAYARLFTMLIPNLGCGGRSYVDTLEYIEAHTGGVSASLSLNLQANDPQQFSPAFQLKTKALRRKLDRLFPLLREMILTANFRDTARLKELLTKHYSGLQSSLTNAPLRYAINLSASGLSTAGHITEAWYGLSYYYMIKELFENFDARIEGLIGKFEELRGQLLSFQNLQLVNSSDANTFGEVQRYSSALEGMPSQAHEAWSADFPLTRIEPQARLIAAPVAFTGKVFRTVPYTHPDSALLAIASFLLDNKVLHRAIREQGGAYGGGSNSNSLSGTFYFFAYRDPNIAATLAAFDESVKVIAEGGFNARDLEDAKLEVIQRLDSPMAPGSRGITAYAWLREGRSQEMRAEFRQRLLAATREDIMRVVTEHLLPAMDSGVVVSFAGKELVEKENEALQAAGRAPLQPQAL